MTASIASLNALPIDTLIAPGGCKGQEFYAPPALVNWIVKQAPRVRRLCSMCTGAFLLAAAGQLQGKRAATHWEWADRLQKLHPKIAIDADKIFIKDGSVWTSAGVSAGIDLALALIEEDYGHQVAIETARQMVMFIKRSGGQSQFSVALAAQSQAGGRFDELHTWVAANTGYVEEQNLRRVFRRQLGVSPGLYRSRFSGHGMPPDTFSPSKPRSL